MNQKNSQPITGIIFTVIAVLLLATACTNKIVTAPTSEQPAVTPTETNSLTKEQKCVEFGAYTAWAIQLAVRHSEGDQAKLTAAFQKIEQLRKQNGWKTENDVKTYCQDIVKQKNYSQLQEQRMKELGLVLQ